MGQALLGLFGMGPAVSGGVAAGTSAFAAAAAPSLAATYGPALATSAASPAAQAVAAAGAGPAGQAATAAAASKAALGSTLLKGALSAAPSAISAVVGHGSQPRMPKESKVDLEAAGAAERDRLRRARLGSRATILTGPGGAPGSPLVGRTILSGG